MRARIVLVLLVLGVVGATMVLGANVYQAIVEVPNWNADPPATVADFRACVRHSHPGYFFQVFVPLTILSLLVSLGLGWNKPKERNRWVMGALLGVLAAEIFTVVFFFPRNEILFFGPMEKLAASFVAQSAAEWKNAHFLRMAMLIAGVACAVRGLLIREPEQITG
jgi:uncharacterized membrane protein